MRATVRKWGNSAAIRIPASVLEAARLKPDQAVDVREEKGRIIIEAAKPESYTFDALLAGITPKNIHEEVDMGRPVGKEIL